MFIIKRRFTFLNKLFLFEIHSFICDSPTLASLKCVKIHCGYSACSKCFEPGENISNKTVLLGLIAQKNSSIISFTPR